MFIVYQFSTAEDDFVILGGFTKREDAELFVAAENATKSPLHQPAYVVEQSFRDALGAAVVTRLGKLADALEKLGLSVKQAD